MASSSSPLPIFYKTKLINFNNGQKRIIMQSKNGPCAFIAICNFLLLRDGLDIGDYCLDIDGYTVISHETLINLLGFILSESSDGEPRNQEKIDNAINFLPTLVEGLDVYIKFTGIYDIGFHPECTIFDVLGIRVCHGWLVDPEDTDTAEAFALKSYSILTTERAPLLSATQRSGREKKEDDLAGALFRSNINDESSGSKDHGDADVASQIRNGCSDVKDEMNQTVSEGHDKFMQSVDSMQKPAEDYDSTCSSHIDSQSTDSEVTTSDVEEGILSFYGDETLPSLDSSQAQKENYQIKNFLETNSSQLTIYGLFLLHTELQEGGLFILFRNDHFGILYKKDKELYHLVTDESYLLLPFVWEKLNEVNGNTVFVTDNFTEIEYAEQKADEYITP